MTKILGWVQRIAWLAIATPLPAAQDGANIVLIVSDDQGYADISCYPHPDEVATPNLDRIAAGGVRLTNGYASCPVCAPTRAGILTGRYQQRFGFYTAANSNLGRFSTILRVSMETRTIRRSSLNGYAASPTVSMAYRFESLTIPLALSFLIVWRSMTHSNAGLPFTTYSYAFNGISLILICSL